MLKATLRKWNQSIDSYGRGQTNEAIGLLTSVDPTAKINYNIGVMYCKNANYAASIDFFTRSIDLDKWLAASYFMRGVANHLSGNLNHAIVDYDESIQRLRGHEYIDYRQLGLDTKLLLCEILFNKAIALGRAGGSVAAQALQCMVISEDPSFRQECKRLQDTGGSATFNIRMIPINLLFRPPKVSDKDGPSSSASSASSSSNSIPIPKSSGVSTASSGGSLPSPPVKKPSPPLPTPPKPPSVLSKSFSPTTTTTTTSYSSLSSSTGTRPAPSPSFASKNPPKPPPLPKKPLPSRPISMIVQEVSITIKVTYKDKRLIQITNPCNISTLRQKVDIKFGINSRDLYFKYPYSGDNEYYPIKSQKDLDLALSIPLTDLVISDYDDTDYNSNSSYSSSYEQPSHATTTTTSGISLEKSYNTIPTRPTQSRPAPPIPTASNTGTIGRSNSRFAPPIPARNPV
ncbi:hypothetical protein CYY_000255 [Polysphondylium violaceum]|uniref:PB1 domain-containing protein n=1 Tax=Polysphondylium violaceum TaxID=133409 RepID=A0A8J4V5S8_9MYCE|nr:hypothetical protein CYY_000255 [Polysphondylium violaceum]